MSDIIVVLLTNEGYVAIENGEIFELWKNKSYYQIRDKLQERYPNYEIHLGSLKHIEFHSSIEVSNQYLNELQTKYDNLKNNNKMKHLTFNAKTAKTLTKVATGFTTQKVFGSLHLTVQTGADVLQSGANALAKSEAAILNKLSLYHESKDELKNIRQERTKGYQDIVKQAPKHLSEVAEVIGEKFGSFINKKTIKSVNQ